MTLYDDNARAVRVLAGPSAEVTCVATDGVQTVCGDDSGGLFAWTAEGEPAARSRAHPVMGWGGASKFGTRGPGRCTLRVLYC